MPAITPEMKTKKIDAVLASLRGGTTIEAACALAHPHRNTLRKWRGEDETLRDEVVRAQESAIAVCENALHKKAREGNVGALALWLCNRAPDRWQHVSHIKVDGSLSVTTLKDAVQEFAQHGRKLAPLDQPTSDN